MTPLASRLQHADGPPTACSRRAYLVSGLLAAAAPVRWACAAQPGQARVPVLAYHRFADTAADSMTVRVDNFAAHLRLIKDQGFSVIALADLVAYRLGRLASLPPKPVVITVDDGHRSVFERMAPMLKGYNWPVTLFIYPSAISNASYAMRWEHLQELQASGPYSIESHTYWHPHLTRERRSRPPEEFQRFAEQQLRRSKAVLEQRLKVSVSALAWPFGMTDAGLMEMAGAAGYHASFSLGEKPCTVGDPVQALPRYLMIDAVDERRLTRILSQAAG